MFRWIELTAGIPVAVLFGAVVTTACSRDERTDNTDGGAARVSIIGVDSAAQHRPTSSRSVRERRGDTTVMRVVGADSVEPAALTREIAIGGRDSTQNELLTAIELVEPLADGGAIFVDAIDRGSRVLEFDNKGTFVRNIGRRGEGPGEYTTVRGIVALPDNRRIITGSRGRGTLVLAYSQTGEFQSEWMAPFPRARFVDSDGHLLMEGTINDPEFPDSLVQPLRQHLLRPVAMRTSISGVVVDTVVSPRANTMPRSGFVTGGASYTITYQLPYMPQFHRMLSPLGYFVSGDGIQYSVSLSTSDRNPLLILSDREAVSIAAEERSDKYNSMRAKTDSVKPSDIPTHKPFFKALRVDHDGRVWVWLSQPSVKAAIPADVKVSAGAPRHMWIEPAVFDVFAPNGEVLGSVRLPDNATFAAAKGDILWLVEKDANEVPRLVRYHVQFR